MDLGEFYEKYKQYYYWKLSRNISGMGLIFPAEDIIHDVVVTMIADEKHRTKFERLPETEAKAYFMSCLKHRLVDIIRREKRRREYLETLDRKALRLKALIEDLFEVSKANSRNITLDIRDVDIVSMVKQVEFEMEDKLTDAGLEVRMSLPEEKVIVPLDSQKTFRIFENLFGNIAKYALPGTRVYVNGFTAKEDVTIILKNITAQELSVSGEELTERFVRGDTSRNTEGSGLGLAIAKSFTELQSGKFRIELDGDLFKVVLTWKVKSQNGQNMVPRESETAEKNENSDCLS